MYVCVCVYIYMHIVRVSVCEYRRWRGSAKRRTSNLRPLALKTLANTASLCSASVSTEGGEAERSDVLV
jgi:hypothetical protein